MKWFFLFFFCFLFSLPIFLLFFGDLDFRWIRSTAAWIVHTILSTCFFFLLHPPHVQLLSDIGSTLANIFNVLNQNFKKIPNYFFFYRFIISMAFSKFYSRFQFLFSISIRRRPWSQSSVWLQIWLQTSQWLLHFTNFQLGLWSNTWGLHGGELSFSEIRQFALSLIFCQSPTYGLTYS